MINFKEYFEESNRKGHQVDNDIENPFFQEGDYVKIIVQLDYPGAPITFGKIKKIIKADFDNYGRGRGEWKYNLEDYNDLWFVGRFLEKVDLSKIKDENDNPDAANLLNI